MKKENKTEEKLDLSMFKTYYVGGKKFIDLTSIDKKYEPYKMLGDDWERQKRYDYEKVWNPRWR